MSLSARAIALQGFGFGATQIALQGLLAVAETPAERPAGGGGFRPRRAQVRGNRRRDEEELILLMAAALLIEENE